jgi:hypothetical protein
MKKFTISILLLLSFLQAWAQDKPSFIAIRSGASFPVGKFHSKSLPDGGYAQTGFNVSMEGAWFFKPKFGIGANAGINFHPVDVLSLANDKIKEDPFLQELTIRSEPYTTITAMAGFFTDIPLWKNLSFTGKVLGGLVYGRTPYQLYKPTYYLVTVNWFEVTSASDYKPSFLAGAGFRYDLATCIGFTLDAEFTYTKMDFDFLTADNTIRTDYRVYSFINLAAGLVIKL